MRYRAFGEIHSWITLAPPLPFLELQEIWSRMIHIVPCGTQRISTRQGRPLLIQAWCRAAPNFRLVASCSPTLSLNRALFTTGALATSKGGAVKNAGFERRLGLMPVNGLPRQAVASTIQTTCPNDQNQAHPPVTWILTPPS